MSEESLEEIRSAYGPDMYCKRCHSHVWSGCDKWCKDQQLEERLAELEQQVRDLRKRLEPSEETE